MKGLKVFTINGEGNRVPALDIVLKGGEAVFENVKSNWLKNHVGHIKYKGKKLTPKDGEEYLMGVAKTIPTSRIRMEEIA